MRCEYCKCLRFEHRGFKTADEAHLQNTSVVSPSVSARISPIRRLYNKVRGNKHQKEESKSDEAKDWNVHYVSKHHKSLDALEASATAGCDLCCLLLGGLCEPLNAEARGRHYLELGLTEVRIYWSRMEEPTEESERRGVTAQMQNRLTVECGSDRFMPLGFFESQWKKDENTSKHDAVGDTHTGSQQCFQLAQDWVSKCQNNHRGCRVNPYLETILPTRVINVGAPDECMSYPEPFLDTPGQVKLIHERYATLSHCWGGVTPAMTTLDTIENKLTLSGLPKTFQDAISITRKMGLKYLWIDSLCIIQDSVDDWERESRRMGDYYWYAYFNIAASDASDSTKGCFRARNPTSSNGCKVDISFPGTLCEQAATVHLIPLINDDYDWRSKAKSYLDPRGWVLQERVLAARTLFYGRFQLSFRCAVEDASESAEQGRLFFSSSRKGQQDLILQEMQSILRGPAYNPQTRQWIMVQPEPTETHPNWEAKYLQYPKSKMELRLCNQWLQLVEHYSALKLTKHTDKLYAISGLGTLLSRKLNVSYYAGILCSDFRRSLLWRVEDGNPHSASHSEPAVAPSWSWASIKCEKLRFIYTADLGIEDSIISIIENVSQDHVDTHTSKEGTIQIRGYLLPGLVTAPLNKVLDFDVGRNQASWQSDIEAPRVVDLNNRVEIGEFHPDTWNIVGGDSGEILLESERIWCLPITTIKVQTVDSQAPGMSFATFLGLKRVEGGEKNVFSRVGLGNGFFSNSAFEGEMERLFII